MRHLDLSRADLTHLNRPAWRDRFAAWFDDVMTRPGIYRWALSNQMDKLSINSVWLKEQLSSVNKALDSILSIRPSQTVW